MSTETEARKIPNPLYAAAGAGDLAYQQLRKLPEKVAELRGRVLEMRPVVTEAVSEHNLRADLDKLRETARRNAVSFVTTAQERAQAVYAQLVAHGERVVATARATEAKAQLQTAKAEARDAAKLSSNGGETATPEKAVKRTRPAASK
jgi:heparin binding hemagglutinin HbhA